jgi:hypothetical protein
LAIIKTFSANDWQFDQPSATLVKISSSGLVGKDKSDFLKYASDDFIPVFERIKFAKDEIPVHLIAMGSYEGWGANRNGDGFREKVLKETHPTFVKFAKFFRNHKNKSAKGDPHYGTVKASAYNDKMQRVELLVGLNGSEERAKKNGGFLADQELEKIAKGEEFGVSMAARVTHDICSYCNNKAKTRSEYCTQEKCAAGGCASNLAKLVKVGNDLHHLHVDNPEPVFFDISRVIRPADRTAYGAFADYITKTAADNFGVLDLSVPGEVIDFQSSKSAELSPEDKSVIKLAISLRDFESKATSPDLLYALTPEYPVETLPKYGSPAGFRKVAALAENSVFLGLSDFCKWAGLPCSEADKRGCKNLFKNFLNLENFESVCKAASDTYLSVSTDTQDFKCDPDTLSKFSFDADYASGRLAVNQISSFKRRKIEVFEKSACDTFSESLVKYAQYKLAAIARCGSVKLSTAPVVLAILQNRINFC